MVWIDINAILIIAGNTLLTQIFNAVWSYFLIKYFIEHMDKMKKFFKGSKK